VSVFDAEIEAVLRDEPVDPYRFNSLEDAFLYFTECQLAMLEHYTSTKRTPKFQVTRQRSIAQAMIWDCRRRGINPPASPYAYPRVPRLREILKACEE
jgi:hypothetical protein